MKLVWTSRAAIQAIDAFQYLEEARPGTGPRFEQELRKIVARLKRFPRSSPRTAARHEGEVRNALIRRYGYWVIYEVKPDLVVVLAVWSTVREPGTWQIH